jgi:hypothetical protein
MELIYYNFIVLFILIGIVIWIHYSGYKPRSEYFMPTQYPISYAPIPYIRRPLLTSFSSQPSGYNSGTRNYSNPFFALEVAQGLDTN